MPQEIIIDRPHPRKTRVKLCKIAQHIVDVQGDALVERTSPNAYTPLYLHLLLCAACVLEVIETRVIESRPLGTATPLPGDVTP
jgi:hypothetical protein